MSLLICSDSATDPNMYYVTRFYSIDEFIYLRLDGEHIIVSDMELERARKESRVRRISTFSEYGMEEMREKYGDDALAGIAYQLLRERRIRNVEVPSNFKISYARFLEARGISISITDEIERRREIKSGWEIEQIGKACRICERSIRLAAGIVRKVRDVELVRNAIRSLIASKGYVADEIIVSHGPQSSSPHDVGRGKVRDGESIIVDVAAANVSTRYYADVTRTFMMGEVPSMLAEMYDAVVLAQRSALKLIRDGARCKDVHQAVVDSFDEMGFKHLFPHSTGHGIGLEVHESPRVGAGKGVLRRGNVITVEPGLYHEDFGGVRIEDVVVVKRNGCEKITRLGRSFRI